MKKDRDHRDNRNRSTRSTRSTQVHQVKDGANGTMVDQESMEHKADQEIMEQTLIHVLHVLLDALVKLDSGAILVNVTVNLMTSLDHLIFRRTTECTTTERTDNITLPLVIDVDVALLLQQQLAVDLGLDANATIFEICAAINATRY